MQASSAVAAGKISACHGFTSLARKGAWTVEAEPRELKKDEQKKDATNEHWASLNVSKTMVV